MGAVSYLTRDVWLPFNDAIAEFTELILIGEDGEEERHENKDLPKDKIELRTAIDQDDYGEGIDEKHAELTDEHQHVAQENVAPKPQWGRSRNATQ